MHVPEKPFYLEKADEEKLQGNINSSIFYVESFYEALIKKPHIYCRVEKELAHFTKLQGRASGLGHAPFHALFCFLKASMHKKCLVTNWLKSRIRSLVSGCA